VTQVTHHDDHDVLWPSRGAGGVVYESGGWIWHLDPATDRARRLTITVPGDRPYTTPRWVEVSNRIESFDLSPSAKRAVSAPAARSSRCPRSTATFAT
jgi:tricorn protease